VRDNGDPLAPPSPETERRVAAHLRRARGKSPVFLAWRSRLALVGYKAALSQAGVRQSGLALPPEIQV
jgi:hypothetical protein